MELSPLRRAIAFAVIVVALFGVFAYVFFPWLSSAGAASADGASGRHPAGPGTAVASPSSAPTVSPSGASGSPSTAATPGAHPGGTAGAGQAPDIYQWLPFTSAGLSSAATVTRAFASDYGTYSAGESVAAYLAPMKGLMTAGLADVIGRAFATPGVAAARAAGKQSALASAQITSMRSFGQGSITFVVALTQRFTGGKGSSKQVTSYAITVAGSGTTWRVNDIQLAAAGNA